MHMESIFDFCEYSKDKTLVCPSKTDTHLYIWVECKWRYIISPKDKIWHADTRNLTPDHKSESLRNELSSPQGVIKK